MMTYDTLLTVTSWEDRFELSIKNFLNNNNVRNIILFDFVDYQKEKENNTNKLKVFLDTEEIKSNIVKLKYNDNCNNWKIIADTINRITGSLVVDISTMPRDIIYFSLYHAERKNDINKLYFLYNCPERYSDDSWLTSDPCKPQLIYNMSGICEMENTILIILTGFDRKRVEQLLNYYETKKVYIGLQTGEQYHNNVKNAEQYIEYFKSFLKIENFDLDAYSKSDYGFTKVEEIVKSNLDSNIIVASLGPKPSSIALFRLNKKYQNIGLIHVPVATFNMNYSFGIDARRTIFDQIK
jgi:hypothetical protein